MRDLAFCVNECAVQVSDHASCSSYSNTSCFSPRFFPSIQNTVTCLYKTLLSTHKQILIALTWSKNTSSHSLSITFDQDPSTLFKLNINSRLIFRNLHGSKSIESHASKIEVWWDLSTARYQNGPEPITSFYLFITVDSEPALILGDRAREFITKKVKPTTQTAKFSLISREECFSGNTHYSTRARFCDAGRVHDVLIDCSGENEGMKHPVLSVFVDEKVVIRVKKLLWNFRGIQTILLDGLLVDLMWDVHDWLYNREPGYAVFMFRTRSGLDTRLWLEEKDEDKVEFSLMIYACKNT